MNQLDRKYQDIEAFVRIGVVAPSRSCGKPGCLVVFAQHTPQIGITLSFTLSFFPLDTVNERSRPKHCSPRRWAFPSRRKREQVHAEESLAILVVHEARRLGFCVVGGKILGQLPCPLLSHSKLDFMLPLAVCFSSVTRTQDYMDLVGLDMTTKRARHITWCFKCQSPYPV